MRVWAPSAAAVSVLLALSAQANPASPGEHAYWARHQEVEYLDNLPRPYRCSDLYDKYRDVLIRLGARDLTIYTYGCTGRKDAGTGRPRVELSYAVPAAIGSQLSSNSPLIARDATIELGPGDPRSLTAADCVLLEDMRQTLLTSFAKRVDRRGPCGVLVVDTLIADPAVQ